MNEETIYLATLVIGKNNFIENTAKDYDMSYYKVESIYNRWSDEGLFYEKLEEFIKQRRNKNE